MRYHFTLAESFTPKNCGENLVSYLDRNKIKYGISAGFLSNSKSSRYARNDDFFRIYSIVIDREELSIIMLRVEDVHIIEDTSITKIKNKIRKVLSYITG